MLFNAPSFLFVFLPATLAGFFFLQWSGLQRFQAVFLLTASLAFYAVWSVTFLFLLLGSIGVNFAFGQLLIRKPMRRLLAAAIGTDLALLAVFKYTDFGIATFNAAFGTDLALTGIILPLGISFYTFTQIAYLVDAWRGRAPDGNLVRYALFVSFFPHLIAGPILHHEEMTSQFRDFVRRRVSAMDLAVGATMFAFGLFKKMVLADGYAPLANSAFVAAAHGASPGMIAAWCGVLAYTLQIYFDFSGYIDMALGLARMVGIAMPQNFNSPYKAASVAEFWQRWNMTLSRFLRDYLYIPLGGNRRGMLRSDVNLMITMLLGGLWHGAGWTYVLWGAMQGLFVLVGRIWERLAGPGRIPRIAAVAVTFPAIMVTMATFRSSSVPAAITIYKSMFLGWAGTGSTPPGTVLLELGAGLAIVWLLPNVQQLLARYRPVLGPEPAPQRWQWRLTAPYAVATGLLIVSTVLFGRHVSEFLYFQF